MPQFAEYLLKALTVLPTFIRRAVAAHLQAQDLLRRAKAQEIGSSWEERAPEQESISAVRVAIKALFCRIAEAFNAIALKV